MYLYIFFLLFWYLIMEFFRQCDIFFFFILKVMCNFWMEIYA
jgi:hypothetical protein